MECPDCHEKTVDKDQHYCQEQLVCTSCGYIFSDTSFATAEEGTFVTEKNQFSNLPWDKRRQTLKTNTEVFKSGLERIEYLSSSLNISNVNRTASIELYRKAVAHEQFNHLHIEKKKALAACAVYTILRQNNLPITLSHLCSLAQVTATDFNSVFRDLVRVFNINISATPIEEAVPVYLEHCKMEDKQRVIKKATEIIHLAHELWLTYSKKPDGIISAATYLAWSSMDINKRSKVLYPKFCLQVGLPIPPSGKIRCREMTRMLVKLAAQVPWIQKKNLEKRTCLLYCLNDVLKHYHVLAQAAIASENVPEEKEWRVFLPKPKVSRPKHKSVTPDEELNIEVSNSPELTDADIPEDKLHKFIRSPEEVEQLKIFEAKLM